MKQYAAHTNTSGIFAVTDTIYYPQRAAQKKQVKNNRGIHVILVVGENHTSGGHGTNDGD